MRSSDIPRSTWCVIQATTVPEPVYLPSSSEVAMCAAFVPDRLNPIWKTLKPSVIRTMIYRAIAGCSGFEKLNEAAWYAHELLVMAELHPTVWNHPSTRSLEQQKHLHTKGICISCHSVLKFPNGDKYPFKEVCLTCINNPEKKVIKVHPCEIPFWGNSCSWPVAYQLAAIDYIIKNRVVIDRVQELDFDRADLVVPMILEEKDKEVLDRETQT